MNEYYWHILPVMNKQQATFGTCRIDWVTFGYTVRAMVNSKIEKCLAEYRQDKNLELLKFNLHLPLPEIKYLAYSMRNQNDIDAVNANILEVWPLVARMLIDEFKNVCFTFIEPFNCGGVIKQP